MKIISTLLIAMFFMVATAFAQSHDTRKAEDRLKDAGVVMSEVLNMPDTIPHYVLDRTKCVVVVPSVRKAAFVVGASYGRGAMVCRTGEDFTGPWGAPSMMAVEGASFGFQIGAEATDFVFLIMNEHGADSLLRSKVKLGGDAAAVAAELRMELIAAEREYIYRLLQDGQITDEARRRIERELDLEEASITLEREDEDDPPL